MNQFDLKKLTQFRTFEIFSITFICIVILGFIFSPILNYQFYNGDYYIFKVSKILADLGKDYWSYIFTHLNGFGVQYRPLGFFGFFYTITSLQLSQPLVLRLLAVLLIAMNGLLIWLTCRRLRMSLSVCFLSLSFFLIHPALHYTVLDISSIAKYLFPSLILSTGIYICLFSSLKSFLSIMVLTTLCAIAILFHEGSVVFPLTFSILLLTGRGELNPLMALIFIPSFVYLIFRLFFWHIPSPETFMGVGLSRFPFLFLKLNSILWVPGVWSFNSASSLSFLSFISILLILFLTIKLLAIHKIALKFLLGIWISILPFCLLQSHYEFDLLAKAGVWATPFATLTFAVILHTLFERLDSKRFSFIVIFLVLFIYGSLSFRNEMNSNYHKFVTKIEDLKEKLNLSPNLNNRLQENKFMSLFKYNIKDTPYNRYFYDFVAPAYVASVLPKSKFIMESPFGLRSLVHGGVAYRLVKVQSEICEVKDIYNFDHFISCIDVDKNL